LLHQLARVHDADSIRNVGNDAKVVADVEDGGVEVTAQVGDQIEDTGFHCHVQRRRWLVGDEQGWVVQQRHTDDHALLLPTGKLVGVALQHRLGIRHVHPFQHFEAPRLCLVLAEVPVDDERFGHLLADAQAGIQRRERILIDHGHLISTQPA